ncbi:MAG: YggS family pyridoxal phosphate-dependent enzyme [bacterium]
MDTVGNRIGIGSRIDEVKRRIAAACRRAGRDPADVRLVAVTKTVPVERIQQAVDAGLTLLGENRVQEAASKTDRVMGDVTWHLVGHLQTNKVKKAVATFSMIQSVDSLELAREIDRRVADFGGAGAKRMDALVEVNTSGEATKFGVRPEECVDLVAKIAELMHVSVKGLMTIGAFTPDDEAVRACFKRLRDLRERIQDARIENASMDYLSMGMTSDFEAAIEEGSNMVRIGTAIFGPREDSLAT